MCVCHMYMQVRGELEGTISLLAHRNCGAQTQIVSQVWW